tara:strand:+ start:2011 stop:2892 length:882 start_codon:yes stop_codon:yes gene_type:complete
MKDVKEIVALVSLLDDPDINIYNLVKSQLIDVGNDCIPILEKANFENDFDEVYQSRIKGITHEIRLNEILSNHKEWIHHPVNLIDGVNQIDQYFFPNITRHYVENEIKNIVKEITALLTENMSALEKVSIINDVLYEEYKFRGDKRNYHSSENSSFGKLLQNKKGNPLSNSILYIEIARQLNLPIMGINLPNHFIVAFLNIKDINKNPNRFSFKKEDVLFYINPFSQGVILKKQDIKDFIQQINVIKNEYYFTPCPFSHITKRMLTNLNFSFKKTNDKIKKNDIEKIIELYKP